MVHVKPKRPIVPVAFLQSVIDEIVTASSEKALTPILERFDSPHHFERPEERNLINWFKVLNRFDELLERYVSVRNVLSKSSSAEASARSSQDRSSSDASFPHGPSGPENVSSVAVDATHSKPDPSADKANRTFAPSPSLVRLILRVTQRLLRNASHDTRTVYNSVEHIGALLADDNPAIVLLSLEVLNMLMQRSNKLRPNRTHITFELSERLLELAHGWGGRENRLGMLECCSSKNVESLPADGKRLYFEYKKSPNPAGQSSEAQPVRPGRQSENQKKSTSNLHSRLGMGPIPLPLCTSKKEAAPEGPTIKQSGSTCAIVLDDATKFEGSERWLLEFANQHDVPRTKWFAFLSAFRRARDFGNGRLARIESTIIRLYAITALFQVQPVPPPLHDLIHKEPELLHDIVSLACASDSDGVADVPSTLRIIAIRCLTAMSTDRHRVNSVISATGVNAHHGALPGLLRTEISAMLSASSDSNAVSSEKGRLEQSSLDRSPSQGRSSMQESQSRPSGGLTISFECSRVSSSVQRIQMTESLLALVHSLAAAAGSSGATPLANSGVLGILIPLLTDRDLRHSRVVAQAIRAMQAIVEGSAQTLGCQMFRDQDGLDLVAKRIAAEVGIGSSEQSADKEDEDEALEVEALKKRGESRELYARLGERQMTPIEALENPPPSSGATSRGLLPHSKWALLRALHQLLLRALGNGGSEVRDLVANSDLPRAMRKIMAQPFLHGGSLFQSAAMITTEIAHAEPTATPELVKAGIAATVLKTIKQGLPPCSEAVRCIPNLLAALCLAPSARDIIVSSKPLKPYLLRLATPFYSRSLHGESPVMIGSSLDELMRHVEALRSDGSDAMIEYLKLSADFVAVDTRKVNRAVRNGTQGSSPMKIEEAPTGDGVVEKPNQSTGSLITKGDGEKTSADAVLLDKMKLALANNSCRLAGFAQASSEHQEGIVQKGGLDHIIQLRLSPALASAEASIRDGPSFSRHYPTPSTTVVSLVSSLRNLFPKHAGVVLRSLFSVILKDAACILKIAKELGNAWLPEEDAMMSIDADSGGGSKKDGTSRGSAGKTMSVASLLVEDSSDKDKKGAGETSVSEKDNTRVQLRKNMSDALKRLRVGVVLLSGLSRSSGAGAPAGVWESARGSQVAAIVSTVERAARYHLATVYTGLTLSASQDGDLSTAKVTATANPEMKSLRPEGVDKALGDMKKVFGWSVATDPEFIEACKKYKIPAGGHQSTRREIKGLAWCLVTFAVAAQRLYSNLARGLTFSSRRLSRDPARHAASARSLAATIGRIFALHLMAAEQLWDVKVMTMGDDHVVAAWDYVRGILIEINGTLFDDSRRGTQALILKSFLDAGGAEALAKATQPFLLVQAAGSVPIPMEGVFTGDKPEKHIEEDLNNLLRRKSLSVSSYVLALSEISHKRVKKSEPPIQGRNMESSKGGASEMEDTIMSSDSVSNQARGISKIVVSESDSPKHDNTDDKKAGHDLFEVLNDEKQIADLREKTARLRDITFTHCRNAAIRRIASDVWNTLCGFLQLLGSCPGLLGANTSPVPESSGSSNEWEPRDIQRSSLTVALNMLMSVTNHPGDLLRSFRADGSAMSDILGIVHTTSQLAEELSQRSALDESGSNAQQDSEGVGERVVGADPPRPPSPDPEMLRTLVEMGFPERRAAAALRRTGLGGIEYATEWLLTHRGDDSDDSGAEGSGGWRNWDEGSETPQNTDEGAGDEEGEQDSGEADADESRDSGAAIADVDGSGDAAGDDMMTDAADVGQPSVSNEVAATSERNGPTATSTQEASGEDTTNGEANRAEKPEKQRSDKGKSSDKKTKEGTVSVPLDKDGVRFLYASMETELSLLSAALDKSKMVSGDEVKTLVSAAAVHAGPTLSKMFEGLESIDHGKPKVNVTPISVDLFIATKKRLFESLLHVTRAVIQKAESHLQGRHLPYLAVELLSILHKDGGISADRTSEFGNLLDRGLRQALAQQMSDGSEATPNLMGQTTAIWSHYGGNRARRALQLCGTFELAYDCVAKDAVDWKSKGSSSPFALGSGSRNTTGVLKGKLRSVTKEEARALKSTTTCLLLLDSFMRYQKKDSIIERSKEPRKPKEDDSGPEGKGAGAEKQAEKMETDGASDKDGSDGPSRDTDSITPITPGYSRKPLSEVMQDILGATSSAMDIDDKPDEETVDLDAIRQAAQAEKTKMIESVKKSVNEWITSNGESAVKNAFPKKELLKNCISLLTSWKAVEVGDAFLACLQLLASLTSDWELANEALKQRAVNVLLGLPQLEPDRSSSTDFKVVRLLVKTILRHILEDPNTLQEAMVSEFRSLLSHTQSRTRTGFSVRSLIVSTSPMASRDMQCYLSALTDTVRASDGERRGELQLIDKPVRESSDIEALLGSRPNVTEVVSSLASLMFETFDKTFGNVSNPQLSTHDTKNELLGLCRYALDLLSEFAEFSQVAAVAYIKTASPSPEVAGSALDFVIQKILTLPVLDSDKNSSIRTSREREELSTAARNLFLALCSKTANTHHEAVASLARAAQLEADRPQVRAEVIAGLAQCIVPATKLRVLRVILDSGIANDLARSLRTLDLSMEKNFDVAMFVLRALSLIGQASTHLARHGNDVADDLTFGSSSRDPWSALRDREDGIGHGGSNYIPVL